MFEQFAAFGKGLRAATFRLDDPPAGDALFPYNFGIFGSGANLAIGSDMLTALGGFDEALGAGTPAWGGEELDIFLRTLRLGASVTYDPRAIVWHEHPAGWPRLHRQAFRYGIGLGAILTKQLVEPAHRRELLRRVPLGVAHLLNPISRKNAGKGEGYPRRLDLLERLGMACGPVAYGRSRARLARRA